MKKWIVGFALFMITLAGVWNQAKNAGIRRKSVILSEESQQISFVQTSPALLRQKSEGSFLHQGLLQILANGCKLDNPLSEISEVVIRLLCQLVGLCVQG